MKRTMTKYVAMNPHHCMACWECIEKCPKNIIGKADASWHRHVIFKDPDACIGCGRCIKACPNDVFFKPGSALPVRKVNTEMSFRIERLLPMTFIASAVTGIGLHMSSHGTWHNWEVAHIISSLLWLLSVTTHMVRHRHWYKKVLSKDFVSNRWITSFLTILFLIVAVTGIILILCIEGANSPIGLWHYKLGMLLLVFSMIHIFHRK